MKLKLIISILVLVALIALLIFRQKRKSCVCLNSGLDLNRILAYGETGLEVQVLQEWINCHQNQNIAVDGIWGEQTESALKSAFRSTGHSFDEQEVFVMLSDLDIPICTK